MSINGIPQIVASQINLNLNCHHNERTSTTKATITTEARAQITKPRTRTTIEQSIHLQQQPLPSSPTPADPTKQLAKSPRCTSMEQIGEAAHKENTQGSRSQTLRQTPNSRETHPWTRKNKERRETSPPNCSSQETPRIQLRK